MSLTPEQIKNLLKNPTFFAEQTALRSAIHRQKEKKPEGCELTQEQMKNLLKNPLFFAEHEAHRATLAPSTKNLLKPIKVR